MQHDRSKDDRRRHPRHALHGSLSVELRVEVSGEKPAVLLARGLVADISRGGVRCDIDFAIPVGTGVDLCFPDAPGGALQPLATRGRVVRMVSPGGVADQIAIAFSRPLQQLDAARLRAHEPVASSRRGTSAGRRDSWAKKPSAFPTLAAGNLS